MCKSNESQLMFTGVLLAAGGSTRMGQPKQLLDWQGQPLIAHTIRQLWDAGCQTILVVLGSSAWQCRQACNSFLESESQLSSAIVWVENDDWRLGQAGSLRLAIDLITSSHSLSNHVLVALGDQPKMLGHHFRTLMTAVATTQVKVAATRYHEGGGVPACFRQDCVRALMSMQHDTGAKDWIRRQKPSDVALFEFGDASMDIDTAEDWRLAIR